MLVKLAGKEAPAVMNKHSCWLPDLLASCVNIGGSESYLPAIRLEESIKYLGIMISYANFEMLTLKHRIAEATKKLRCLVYNRSAASPKARLKVWFTTVWATLVTGLLAVGVTLECARHLRGWFAHKIKTLTFFCALLQSAGFAGISAQAERGGKGGNLLFLGHQLPGVMPSS